MPSVVDENRPRRYICGTCGKEFPNQYALSAHESWHDPNRKRKSKKFANGDATVTPTVEDENDPILPAPRTPFKPRSHKKKMGRPPKAKPQPIAARETNADAAGRTPASSAAQAEVTLSFCPMCGHHLSPLIAALRLAQPKQE